MPHKAVYGQIMTLIRALMLYQVSPFLLLCCVSLSRVSWRLIFRLPDVFWHWTKEVKFTVTPTAGEIDKERRREGQIFNSKLARFAKEHKSARYVLRPSPELKTRFQFWSVGRSPSTPELVLDESDATGQRRSRFRLISVSSVERETRKWRLCWCQCYKTFYGRNLRIFVIS